MVADIDLWSRLFALDLGQAGAIAFTSSVVSPDDKFSSPISATSGFSRARTKGPGKNNMRCIRLSAGRRMNVPLDRLV